MLPAGIPKGSSFRPGAGRGELRDLAAKRPDVAARLTAAFHGWLEDTKRDASAPPPLPPPAKKKT